MGNAADLQMGLHDAWSHLTRLKVRWRSFITLTQEDLLPADTSLLNSGQDRGISITKYIACRTWRVLGAWATEALGLVQSLLCM